MWALVMKQSKTAKTVTFYDTTVFPRVGETVIYNNFESLHKVEGVAYDYKNKVCYVYLGDEK